MNKFNLIFLLFILLTTSCLPEPAKKSVTSTTDDPAEEIVNGNPFPGIGNSNPSPGTGNSNPSPGTGNSNPSPGTVNNNPSPGTGNSNLSQWTGNLGTVTVKDPNLIDKIIPSPFSLTIKMAGGQNWKPGGYYNKPDIFVPFANDLTGAQSLFKTKDRLKVKFKVLPIENSNTNCYGKQRGSTIKPYTRLKFKVSLRDINTQTNYSAYPPTVSKFLGHQYRTTTVGHTKVGYYSEVVDFSNLKHNNPNGVIVEVHDVKSNSECLNMNNYETCLPTNLVDKTMCWKLEMLISTDSTRDM